MFSVRWISSPCRIPSGTAAVSAIKDTPDLKATMSDVNVNMERTPINPARMGAAGWRR
jgi:hypothetical protein